MVRAGSLRLILDEFEAVSETRGFVEHMGLRLLVDILDKDEVRVKSESVVFEAAVRWLSAPGRERAGGEPAQRVLQRVRYPLVDSEYLLRRVAHCEEAGVKGSEAALKELVSEALALNLTRLEDGQAGVERALEEGVLVRSARMRPRVGYGVDAMAMECGKVVQTGHIYGGGDWQRCLFLLRPPRCSRARNPSVKCQSVGWLATMALEPLGPEPHR